MENTRGFEYFAITLFNADDAEILFAVIAPDRQFAEMVAASCGLTMGAVNFAVEPFAYE